MIPANKIMIALDFDEEKKALSLLDSLKDQPIWVKIGMELFYASGPKVIDEVKERGFNVFLDLKLHDIPHTVEKALRSLLKFPLDMINVHSAGGSEMMKRASSVIKSSSTPPLLIAVTQLTSTTNVQMNLEQRIPGDIIESVVHLARLAKDCGCDGVVSSPHEVQAIKLICGSRFLTVTPGIRPLNTDPGDQNRFASPKEALLLGSDYLVIGRPITQASDPKSALDLILKG